MPVPHRRATVPVVVLSAVLSACGGTPPAPAKPPAPTPTALQVAPAYFPELDTPYDAAPADLKTYWAPYSVGTIPGQHAVDNIPPAPRVVNLTGVVPDSMAQQWGQALMRTAAWERWAIKASQGVFLQRFGKDATVFGMVGQGATVTRPDCDAFPTGLVLTENTNSGVENRSQYDLSATYEGPDGTQCTVLSATPGGSAARVRSYTTQTLMFGGWMHIDPILGSVWVTDARDDCGLSCPQPPPVTPPPVNTVPQRPDVDTPLDGVSPLLRRAWTGYEASVVPSADAVSNIPTLPRIDLQAPGITEDTATTWEVALFRDLAWQQWTWRQGQIPMQAHLQAKTAYNPTLGRYIADGGHTDLPGCASFPQTVAIRADTAKQLRDIGDAAASTGYHIDLTFDPKCSVAVTLADGTSKTTGWPHSVSLYGDLRSDPLLGTVWVPQFLDNHDR
jgi:hypothetical protein